VITEKHDKQETSWNEEVANGKLILGKILM